MNPFSDNKLSLYNINTESLYTYLVENYASISENIFELSIFNSVITQIDDITNNKNISDICPNLKKIFLRNIKKLKNIKISENIEHLFIFDCINLKNIDFMHAINLNWIDITNTEIKIIDFNNCPNLNHIELINNRFTKVELNNTKISELDLSNNAIEEIKLDCPNLGDLNLDDNKLRILDLSGCPRLEACCLANNKISTLDLSQNSEIKILYLNDNRFTKVELNKIEGLYELANLVSLNIQNNPLKINCYDLMESLPQLKRIYIDSKQFSTSKTMIITDKCHNNPDGNYFDDYSLIDGNNPDDDSADDSADNSNNESSDDSAKNSSSADE
jgi:hypothetical protein